MMAGRKHTDTQIRARLEDVESAVKTGQGSRKNVRQLAERWSVTSRQIHRDRARVLGDWTLTLSEEDRETKRAQLLSEVRTLRAATAVKALTESSGSMLKCAVNLMELELNLLGLNEPMEVRITHDTDPFADARSVIEAIPDVAKVLGLDNPVAIIEAAYQETEDG